MKSYCSAAVATGAFSICSLGFNSAALAQAPPGEADLGSEEGGVTETESAPVESQPAPATAAPAPAEQGETADAFYSQDSKKAQNTIYLELLGPGLLYSFNYERGISDLNLRVGVGGASWGGSGYVQIPVGVNYIGVGGKLHHLELGATANIMHIFSSVGDSYTAVTFSPIVGYRRQSVGPGFNFRAGLSPIVAGFGEGLVGAGFFPWPYVSFGATF